MRGRQSEKTTIKAGEREGGRAEVRGGKENKSLIIYLEDTSSSTFSSGQRCSVLYSVGKLFHMI